VQRYTRPDEQPGRDTTVERWRVVFDEDCTPRCSQYGRETALFAHLKGRHCECDDSGM
jgi:hypothetical protein